MSISKSFSNPWISLKKFLGKNLQAVGLLIVWTYRLLLAPFLGGQCRFSPSCSCYAEEALKAHPPIKAFKLIVRRLAQCRPGGHYGLDPVPRAQAEGLHP